METSEMIEGLKVISKLYVIPFLKRRQTHDTGSSTKTFQQVDETTRDCMIFGRMYTFGVEVVNCHEV